MEVTKLKKVHNGNLKIKKDRQYDFSELEEITGDFVVPADIDLELPELITIGGHFKTKSRIKLPKLATIKGSCSIYEDCYKFNVKYELPKLTNIYGTLHVESSIELPELTEVGGCFFIMPEIKLPKLTTIGYSGFTNYAGSVIELPELTTISGDFYNYRKTTLPKLKTISGSFYTEEFGMAKLPELTTVGKRFEINNQVELPKLKTIGGDCWIRWDNTELPELTTIGGYCIGREHAEIPKLTTIGEGVEIITNLKQRKILNNLLKFKEQDFFCSYDNGNHDYYATGDIISLLVAGAKPTDHNIYKNVLQVAEEMEETGMSPFFHAKSSIKQYISSILQEAPNYVQYDLYQDMIGEIQV